MGRRIILGVFFLVLMLGAQYSGDEARVDSSIDGNGWEIECINCPRFFDKMSPRAAQIDEAGYIHVAYGGDHLYYAVGLPGGPWQIETVDDSPNVGLYAALTLDSADEVHVVYFDAESNVLKYAYQDDTGWAVESITFLTSEEPHYAMALDLQDRLVMSFYQASSGDLYFVVRLANGTWQLEEVDEVGDVGQYNSITLDDLGNPHIVYRDETDDRLKYAYDDGNIWHLVHFDNVGSNYDTSIVLDSSGYPHIAYRDGSRPSWEADWLMYLFEDAAGWHEELIDDDDNDGYAYAIGHDISLYFDGAETAHVSYSSANRSYSPYPWYTWFDTRYAIREADGWSLHRVEAGYGDVWSRYGSLILDRNHSYIIFRSSSLSNDPEDMATLTLATIIEGSWSFQRIDHSRDIGRGADIVVDYQGRPQVSYLNDWSIDPVNMRGTLNHSIKTTADWMHNVDLMPVVDTDFSSFLAVDQQNSPYIVSTNFNRVPSFYMTYFDGQEWQNQSGPGYSADIAADAEGVLHASVDRGYRVWDGEWGEIEQVDEFGSSSTSISLDSSERSHIAYSYFSPQELRFAVKTPSGWLTETVTAGQFSHVSIDMDSTDLPIIIAYEFDENLIIVARKEHGVWYSDQIAWLSYRQPVDIVIDLLGRIHVSYYDSESGDLGYALYTDDWHGTIVASEGDVGSYSAMALGTLNTPMIAYYDATLRDLKMAILPTDVVGVAYLPEVAKP